MVSNLQSFSQAFSPVDLSSFSLKTHQMLSVCTTLDEFANESITGHFGFVFEENSVRKIT